RAYIDFIENPEGIDGRTGAQINGIGSLQETQDLAQNLRIGALPVKLRLISKTQVSASLGKQALHQGLIAGAVGLLLTILFLLAFYRVLGVVAMLGLITYGLLLFWLIKLIPITMTLPGIAGMILTLGVAADANIVIFERIKEEIRHGRSIPAAISTSGSASTSWATRSGSSRCRASSWSPGRWRWPASASTSPSTSSRGRGSRRRSSGRSRSSRCAR